MLSSSSFFLIVPHSIILTMTFLCYLVFKGSAFYTVETKIVGNKGKSKRMAKVKEQAHRYAMQMTAGMEVGTTVHYGIAIEARGGGEEGAVQRMGQFKRNRRDNSITHIEECNLITIE